MKNKNLMDESLKDKIVHNILKKFAKEKHPELKEYKYEDGFWVFAVSQENADKKHQEWLNK